MVLGRPDFPGKCLGELGGGRAFLNGGTRRGGGGCAAWAWESAQERWSRSARENCGGGILKCLLACLHQRAGEQALFGIKNKNKKFVFLPVRGGDGSKGGGGGKNNTKQTDLKTSGKGCSRITRLFLCFMY